MRRDCDTCGKPYEAKRPSSRYCQPACRTRASRSGKSQKVVELPVNDGTLGVEQGEVEQATARRIAVLELQDEPHAKIALALAARIDSPFETGSALAALTKQLTTLLDDLAGRGKRAGDAVDELKARRLEKARGA